MKKISITAFLLSAALLTGCGSSSNYASDTASISQNSKGYSSYDSASEAYYDSDYSYSDEVENADASSNGSGDEDGLTADRIKKEMLVYSCDMSVDVLDFDTAVSKFKESLDSYGGFVENENYNDGGSGSRWYSEDDEKWQTYSATVRVPSADYDAFCAAAAELGDLRSKNASVQNVSSEYYDLSTTLEIYEAKEERYIALLADITDDEYAISVEKELTELQIEIAKIKTRMNDISTDVAYSFVNISINEVKQYTPEPVQKDTFGQRLKNTISSTASNFIKFLEVLLFVIIALLPYIILIGIIVFVIILIRKSIKKKRAAKNISAAPENVPAQNNTGNKQ